jgi:hypothetical protein
MLKQFFFALSIGLVPIAGAAQTMTPEELAAMVDQRVDALNPYIELLNNPDPQRSQAAMLIMLESGDPTLTSMALEFGLLSPSAKLRRAALQAHLATRPNLTIQFDGSNIERSNYFLYTITRFLDGSVADDGTGRIQIGLGDYSDEAQCFLQRDSDDCLLAVTAGGVGIWIGNYLSANLTLDENGALIGSGDLMDVREPAPARIQLLD